MCIQLKCLAFGWRGVHSAKEVCIQQKFSAFSCVHRRLWRPLTFSQQHRHPHTQHFPSLRTRTLSGRDVDWLCSAIKKQGSLGTLVRSVMWSADYTVWLLCINHGSNPHHLFPILWHLDPPVTSHCIELIQGHFACALRPGLSGRKNWLVLCCRPIVVVHDNVSNELLSELTNDFKIWMNIEERFDFKQGKCGKVQQERREKRDRTRFCWSFLVRTGWVFQNWDIVDSSHKCSQL